VVIAIPLSDKMRIARYGIQATSLSVCRQRTGNVTNATLPCCLLSVGREDGLVKEFEICGFWLIRV